MNPSTNNPNEPKPNFDFIVGQKDPNHSSKPNRKVLILFILVAITIVIIIAGLLLSPSDRVQQGPVTDEEAGQQQTVKDFIALVNENNIDAAYNMFNPDKPPISKEEFIEFAVPLLKGMKLEECTYSTIDATDSTQETRPVASCFTIEDNFQIDQEFEISKDNSRIINNYRLIDTQ